jgi:predicted TIM-barrel fold metal-dependent hydrolase
MGELTTQYAGVPYDDPRMMPYYALAEELDIPVAIHTSGGPARTAQNCCPKFRLALGNPMGLEEVLVRFPQLRVQIMHGWPGDELFSMLYQYPQLVVDLTPWPAIMPVAEFHEILRKYKDAGFLDRVMFGTDTRAENIPRAVAAFAEAKFLTPAELDGILCGNAERFLRRSGICSGSKARQ